jgi:hypothetical protein
MNWENSEYLLKLKLGREEYCQRMLTSLILGGPYPKWNTENEPSQSGVAFLGKLHELSFGEPIESSMTFIDEHELEVEDEHGKTGVPDYVVITDSKAWVIELKTEKASYRKDQMPKYANDTPIRHPNKNVELTYLTGPMKLTSLDACDLPYRHLFWEDVLSLIKEFWGASPHLPEKALCDALEREILGLDKPTKKFQDTAKTIREAISLVYDVQETGKQAGVDVYASDLEELHEIRTRLRDSFASDDKARNVQPWIWRGATSGGQPLTQLGKDTGYEIRLSRYKEKA